LYAQHVTNRLCDADCVSDPGAQFLLDITSMNEARCRDEHRLALGNPGDLPVTALVNAGQLAKVNHQESVSGPIAGLPVHNQVVAVLYQTRGTVIDWLGSDIVRAAHASPPPNSTRRAVEFPAPAELCFCYLCNYMITNELADAIEGRMMRNTVKEPDLLRGGYGPNLYFATKQGPKAPKVTFIQATLENAKILNPRVHRHQATFNSVLCQIRRISTHSAIAHLHPPIRENRTNLRPAATLEVAQAGRRDDASSR